MRNAKVIKPPVKPTPIETALRLIDEENLDRFLPDEAEMRLFLSIHRQIEGEIKHTNRESQILQTNINNIPTTWKVVMAKEINNNSSPENSNPFYQLVAVNNSTSNYHTWQIRHMGLENLEDAEKYPNIEITTINMPQANTDIEGVIAINTIMFVPEDQEFSAIKMVDGSSLSAEKMEEMESHVNGNGFYKVDDTKIIRDTDELITLPEGTYKMYTIETILSN